MVPDLRIWRRGERQRRTNIFARQIGEIVEDSIFAHAARQVLEDVVDGVQSGLGVRLNCAHSLYASGPPRSKGSMGRFSAPFSEHTP